jgi:hypothetical protein
MVINWDEIGDDQLMMTNSDEFDVALQCRIGMSEGMTTDHRAPVMVFQFQDHPEPTDITIVMTPQAWGQMLAGIEVALHQMIDLGMIRKARPDEEL